MKLDEIRLIHMATHGNLFCSRMYGLNLFALFDSLDEI